MIEVTVLNYLKEAFPTTPVEMEIQQGIGDEFILIEKTGSNKSAFRVNSDVLSRSTIAVQSWAGSLYRAMSLNDEVVEAMLGITSIKEVSEVELNSDYNYTDTETKHYRYQAVFDLVHY